MKLLTLIAEYLRLRAVWLYWNARVFLKRAQTKEWWVAQCKFSPTRFLPVLSRIVVGYFFFKGLSFIYISWLLHEPYAGEAGTAYVLCSMYFYIYLSQQRIYERFRDHVLDIAQMADEDRAKMVAEIRYWQTKAHMHN